ncbi:DNA-3-methyladenine glycosylase family protein [Pseudofrankia inefficax]|uniref:DNA-3-methyladenine glycosylase II n=1 Tax=Pseudofrankia inefficax (strain DSM 45817 / CECT 9037 / DDB 130130 / EuI1c) TaxID=298654 RepID=E3IV27_PSEI1|nr:DNA-3-methyladenine glycosylase [Pseudofrankia inefficax]ADP80047.1 HhH-GPD family protein [Pseudofrankia inefficax]
MTTITITPRGPFSLAAGTRFLEGFTPASYDAAPDDVLRLAFPTDDGHTSAGAAIRQAPDGTVHADLTGGADPAAVRAQVARILSLDVDGAAFPDCVAADAVAAGLAARHLGLRPVCFPSPYEAACWTIIGHRIRLTQAARLKATIAREHGETITVAGQPTAAFPTPSTLRTVDDLPGLSELKMGRLRAVAQAALDGELDAATLRALPTEEALRHLQALPGIGPFSAELILIRGAGHPDVFPGHERRLHQAMAKAYHLDSPELGQLSRLAQRWAPFRSWVTLLLRAHATAAFA